MAPRESSRPSNGHRPRERQRGGTASRKNGHRKKKSSQGSRRPVSGGEESRGDRSSKSLSAGALDQLNQSNERDRRRAERAARAAERTQRAERAERVERARRSRPSNNEYRDSEEETPRKKTKDRKRRVVSGAIVEEGRASGLRGGNNRWSDDSLGEKDFYQPRKTKTGKKKKLCRWNALRGRAWADNI